MGFSARRVLVAALLVVAAIIWARINKPVEGDVLLELTSRHGLTTADLLSIVALAMAVVIAWPSRRPPRPGSGPASGPGVRPGTGGYGTTVPSASRPGVPGPPPGTTAGPSRR
jgi:hypothetical protein